MVAETIYSSRRTEGKEIDLCFPLTNISHHNETEKEDCNKTLKKNYHINKITHPLQFPGSMYFPDKE